MLKSGYVRFSIIITELLNVICKFGRSLNDADFFEKWKKSHRNTSAREVILLQGFAGGTTEFNSEKQALGLHCGRHNGMHRKQKFIKLYSLNIQPLVQIEGSITKMGCFSYVQNLVFHSLYVHSPICVIQVIRHTNGEGWAMLLCSFKWIRNMLFVF